MADFKKKGKGNFPGEPLQKMVYGEQQIDAIISRIIPWEGNTNEFIIVTTLPDGTNFAIKGMNSVINSKNFKITDTLYYDKKTSANIKDEFFRSTSSLPLAIISPDQFIEDKQLNGEDQYPLECQIRAFGQTGSFDDASALESCIRTDAKLFNCKYDVSPVEIAEIFSVNNEFCTFIASNRETVNNLDFKNVFINYIDSELKAYDEAIRTINMADESIQYSTADSSMSIFNSKRKIAQSIVDNDKSASFNYKQKSELAMMEAVKVLASQQIYEIEKKLSSEAVMSEGEVENAYNNLIKYRKDLQYTELSEAIQKTTLQEIYSSSRLNMYGKEKFNSLEESEQTAPLSPEEFSRLSFEQRSEYETGVHNSNISMGISEYDYKYLNRDFEYQKEKLLEARRFNLPTIKYEQLRLNQLNQLIELHPLNPINNPQAIDQTEKIAFNFQKYCELNNVCEACNFKANIDFKSYEDFIKEVKRIKQSPLDLDSKVKIIDILTSGIEQNTISVSGSNYLYLDAKIQETKFIDALCQNKKLIPDIRKICVEEGNDPNEIIDKLKPIVKSLTEKDDLTTNPYFNMYLRHDLNKYLDAGTIDKYAQAFDPYRNLNISDLRKHSTCQKLISDLDAKSAAGILSANMNEDIRILQQMLSDSAAKANHKQQAILNHAFKDEVTITLSANDKEILNRCAFFDPTHISSLTNSDTISREMEKLKEHKYTLEGAMRRGVFINESPYSNISYEMYERSDDQSSLLSDVKKTCEMIGLSNSDFETLNMAKDIKNKYFFSAADKKPGLINEERAVAYGLSKEEYAILVKADDIALNIQQKETLLVPMEIARKKRLEEPLTTAEQAFDTRDTTVSIYSKLIDYVPDRTFKPINVSKHQLKIFMDTTKILENDAQNGIQLCSQIGMSAADAQKLLENYKAINAYKASDFTDKHLNRLGEKLLKKYPMLNSVDCEKAFDSIKLVTDTPTGISINEDAIMGRAKYESIRQLDRETLDTVTNAIDCLEQLGKNKVCDSRIEKTTGNRPWDAKRTEVLEGDASLIGRLKAYETLDVLDRVLQNPQLSNDSANALKREALRRCTTYIMSDHISEKYDCSPIIECSDIGKMIEAIKPEIVAVDDIELKSAVTDLHSNMQELRDAGLLSDRELSLNKSVSALISSSEVSEKMKFDIEVAQFKSGKNPTFNIQRAEDEKKLWNLKKALLINESDSATLKTAYEIQRDADAHGYSYWTASDFAEKDNGRVKYISEINDLTEKLYGEDSIYKDFDKENALLTKAKKSIDTISELREIYGSEAVIAAAKSCEFYEQERLSVYDAYDTCNALDKVAGKLRAQDVSEDLLTAVSNAKELMDQIKNGTVRIAEANKLLTQESEVSKDQLEPFVDLAMKEEELNGYIKIINTKKAGLENLDYGSNADLKAINDFLRCDMPEVHYLTVNEANSRVLKQAIDDQKQEIIANENYVYTVDELAEVAQKQAEKEVDFDKLKKTGGPVINLD